MSLPRQASILLAFFTLALAVPVRSAPLTLEDLVEFHHSGLTPDAFRELVTREGLASPVGADAARELQAAGLSSDLVSWLITSGSSRTGGAEGVNYDLDDGVLVVSGEGEATEDGPRLEAPAPAPAPVLSPEAAAPAPTIIIAMAPPPQQPIILPAYASPWGWTSVAQVPARFGDPTSAFGTTIVNVGGAPGCGLVTPLDSASSLRPDDRTVPIHTSRGTIYLPN
jgi:hypothetical protein